MTSAEQRVLFAPEPLHEPATILARPSALAATRALWTLGAGVVAVLLPPHLGQWVAWLGAPLAVSVVLDAGALAALGWLLAGLVLSVVLPPGGVDIVAHAAAIIVTVLVLRRLRVAATVSAWSAAALAALAVLLHDLTLVALAAAQSGRVGVAVLPLLVRVVVGGVIGLAVVGRWNRWAARERARGRA